MSVTSAISSLRVYVISMAGHNSVH